jgi:hypothetical protein
LSFFLPSGIYWTPWHFISLHCVLSTSISTLKHILVVGCGFKWFELNFEPMGYIPHG